jgi:hypothetical protein
VFIINFELERSLKMSTLVTTPQPGVATQTASVNWIDAGSDSFATNMRVTLATTIGQLSAIAGAADVFSQCRICNDGGLQLGGVGYNVTGQDDATDLKFGRRDNYLEFEFRSKVFCSARYILQVPGPLSDAIDPGTPADPATNIFADSTGGSRNVNLNHPAIKAFTTLVAAQIAISSHNVTDWFVVNAERVTTATAYAGKRPS